jgi:2,4-dienoyl-CoA reductase-like NADH-dependent reductase (Old Yellow Enzyme family)/thioredoxin reductase
MDDRYPNLLSPYRIGDRVYKNRILMGPFTPPGAGTGAPNAMAFGWFETRARGGAAQLTLGETAVDLEFGDRKNGGTVNLFTQDMEARMLSRELTMAIQRHGALAAIELCHIGLWNDPCNIKGGQNPLGPSAMVRPDGVAVTELTEEQIDRICDQFADAAESARNLGFDTALIHGGHGWLQAQFLSPAFNHRTDRFGGSLENRARLSLMILDRIRARVGNSILIEYRMSGDELAEGGFHIDEMVEFAKMIDDKVDLIHVSVGQYQDPVRTRTFPSIYQPHGCNRGLSRQIKQAVHSPVAVVGAITDPETAEDIIASGDADFIVMVKQLIADPDYPRKLLEGRRDEIRPCVRCYACMTGFPEIPPNLRCSVNPNATREFLLPGLQPRPGHRRVCVVGGGPAGMQAAITAARNGHEVTLIEQADHLGGTISFTDFDPVKVDLRRLKNHLAEMVEKSGVHVRLNTTATPELIAELQPERLLVAIGAKPIVPPIPGIERAEPATLVYGHAAACEGKRVVIIGGGMVGCETAIYLADAGAQVTVLEMADTIAAECVGMPRGALLDRLAASVTCLTGTTCTAVTESGVTAQTKGGAEQCFEADLVLLAAGLRPDRATAEALAAVVPGAVLLGDCKQSARVREAIESATFAAADL